MSISLHPDTPQAAALPGGPAAGVASEPGAGPRIRTRLFTKYVALFVAVVGVALLANGIFEVFFYYREHKAALIRIQHEQAEAAAAKIGQFVKEIESQLGWTTQLPWSAGSIEQRRFDALRLLRQVPAITELAEVDSAGKERLRVSRLAMDVIDSGLDLSRDPKFTEAVAHKVYYGPVYFRRESEPYMTLALAGTRKDAGVSIAEVNLKLIWDVVSQIKVGEHGHAYVVGPQGRLIAHPDISLVLRNTDMSKLEQVKAAQAGSGVVVDSLQGALNIQGQKVLTASAPVVPLGWTVFIELPVEEAYASLYASLQRLAIVLLAASTFAVLAGIFLARRMVGPIQALRMGAERIGSGDFSQRIAIKTGDELEGLANQFNDMGARLQESYADLESKVEQRTAELSESLQQQTATADVLKVISRSAFDLDTVLTTLITSAAKLCEAEKGVIFLREDDHYRMVSNYGFTAEFEAYARANPFPVGTGSTTSRAADSGSAVQVVDVLADENRSALAREYQRLGGFRTNLGVPLRREGETIGVFTLTRQVVRAFTQRQIELVETFADQAVIAIENVRLFEEVQERTRALSESLEQQTATADVLRVISRSSGDLQPVFDAMLANATRICEARFGMMLLVEGDAARCVALHNAPEAFAELRHREPLIRPGPDTAMGRLLRTKQAVHIVDAKAERIYADGDPVRRANADLAGARTILAVPLLRDTEVIGAIGIFHQEVHPFSDKQIELVTNFGNQAVIAIENARLLQQLRQRTDDLTESLEQQTATADVLRVISSSSGDLVPVFDAMLDKAMQLCGADFGVLNTFDGASFHTAATRGLPSAYDEYRRDHALKYGPDTAPARLLEGDPFVEIVDLLDSEAYRTSEPNRRALVDLGGARSLLAVPLNRDGRVIGNVMIFRQEQLRFSHKQIALLQQFAAQAVIAIENARLLNQLRERTTELSQSLDELRTAQDRLIQTEKLASLGQLTAGIAHEIKNPLNFVNNFSSVSTELIDELKDVLQSVGLDDKMREEIDELTHMLKGSLDKVVQHGKRADSIVKNMLLHSREGAGEHRAADINAIVEESLNLAYHGARAEKSGFNITLKRELDPAAGMLDLYPQEISRVFLNLISNGFYAASKRKEMEGNGFEPLLSATTRNLGDSVEIRIRDNGTGIPAEVKEKMFNPFFTTKPAGEGTGLGLSMSQDIIVKQHGGTIDVDTEPGAFTEFIITLPRTLTAQANIGGRN